MSNTFGTHLRLSIFGQSHGEAIGVTVDGLPAGLKIDMEQLLFELGRRKPGRSGLTTQRKEDDMPEFLSGVLNGVTTGQPLCLIFRNTGMHSSDYGDGVDLARPSHADYTGHVRYFGFEDWRGGGSFSGRLTAPLVAAGTICGQYLEANGVHVESHIQSVYGIRDRSFMEFPEETDFACLKKMELPVLDEAAGEKMQQAIREAAAEGDSVGGEVECRITGLPAGLGAPFFDSVESCISQLMFSIPGVKGIAFGSGNDLAGMRGSQANDAMRMDHGRVVTVTNHAGGINGGITNGMPVIFRLVIRPTPSIAKTQETVSVRRMENAELAIRGRHDPCILSRAVPVVEAMAKLAVMELWKERKTCL